MITQRILQVENTPRQQAHTIAKHSEALAGQGAMLENADKTFRLNLDSVEAMKLQMVEAQVKKAQLETTIARAQPAAPQQEFQPRRSTKRRTATTGL